MRHLLRPAQAEFLARHPSTLIAALVLAIAVVAVTFAAVTGQRPDVGDGGVVVPATGSAVVEYEGDR